MSTSGYLARTKAAALSRAVMRTVVLLGLAAVAVWWSVDEPSAGNRGFLLAVAGLLAVVAGWGAVETRRELRVIRAQSPRRTH
jgi:protein-S-isoprenylcysteine O-methyltransferase Ste14